MKKVMQAIALFSIFILTIPACSQTESSDVVSMDRFVDQIRNAGFSPSLEEVVDNAALESSGRIIEWDSIQIQVYEFANSESRATISDGIDRLEMTRNGIPIVPESPATLWANGSIIVVYQGLDGGTIMLLNGLLGDPISYEGEPANEPYPPAVVAAIRYVSELMETEPGLVEVIDYEQIDWADGCLELPDPDEACTEAITPGWRIDLRANETVFEVRTDSSGSTLRSTNSGE